MLIYVLIILLTMIYFYLSNRNDKNINKYFLILFFVYLMVVFLRHGIGPDYF